ncbi:hypothetical protein MOQ_002559 [Trypanosoma cruzi marinkellei]|uniref:PH-like domain-containing protein n=1 Tax=Trypanosoma cruzi marinkellei TaxID=85056 RepID=K2NXK4_TRYCR|nr:hypothetical protein MOQ_002559 [Trypanosoma cruzi marinkellei]
MARSPNVDLLSDRFREMSLNRDRLLNDGKRTEYNLEGHQQAFKFKEKIGDSTHAAPNTTYYCSLRRDGGLNHTRSLPERRSERCRDVVGEDDRLPSSCTHFFSPFRKNPTNERGNGGNHSRPNCRWITVPSDEDQSRESTFGARRRSHPGVTWSSTSSNSFSQTQPSSLLIALVNDVARRRGVGSPAIPTEVIIAFESCVYRGTSMLKFVSHDAPHERFFMIKFLDFKAHRNEAEPVLCWYTKPRSSTMRRYLPLANLIEVIDGGDGHPAVQKRMVRPGVIKGSAVNLNANYMGADNILQWRFISSKDEGEIVAVKLLCKKTYVAWRIVTDFFSKIGSVVMPVM